MPLLDAKLDTSKMAGLFVHLPYTGRDRWKLPAARFPFIESRPDHRPKGSAFGLGRECSLDLYSASVAVPAFDCWVIIRKRTEIGGDMKAQLVVLVVRADFGSGLFSTAWHVGILTALADPLL